MNNDCSSKLPDYVDFSGNVLGSFENEGFPWTDVNDGEVRFIKYEGRWVIGELMIMSYIGETLIRVYGQGEHNERDDILDLYDVDAIGPKIEFPVV